MAPGETIRWLVIMAGAPLLWCFAPYRVDPAVRWCGFAFLAWAGFTLAWTPAPLDGVLALAHWLALSAVFALGASLTGINGVLAAIALGAAVNGFFAYSQYFTGAVPTGLLTNQNLLAEIGLLGTLAVLCLSLSRRSLWALLLLPLTVTALLGATWPPAAKTIIVGIGMAGMACAIQRRRYVLAGVGIIAVAAAVLIVAWTTGEMTSLTLRIAVWRDAIAGLSPWGHGVGSFTAVFPRFADESLGVLLTSTVLVTVAYNDFLTQAFEIGIGVAPLAAIAIMALRKGMNEDDWSAYVVFAAWLGLGLVNYPLHAPASAFIGALLAGHLCRVRDHAGRGAVDRRDAAGGVAQKPVAQRQGLGSPARRRGVPVLPDGA